MSLCPIVFGRSHLLRFHIFTSENDLEEGDRVAIKFFAILATEDARPRAYGQTSVVQLVLRPIRPRTRSAPLRSAPTECDDLWRAASQAAVGQ